MDSLFRVFSELIDQFTISNRSVIDYYSEAFKTAIGSLRARLKCTVIERSTQCFMAAKVRPIRIVSMLKSKIDEDQK